MTPGGDGKRRLLVVANETVGGEALFPADEIVISTHPPHRSRWLEHGVVERARDEIDLPITHVVVDLSTEHVAKA